MSRTGRLLLLASLAAALPASAQGPRDSLLVSPEWLAERQAQPGLVILQVERNPAAYAEAHLPGARLVPFGKVVVEREGLPNELPPLAQLDSLLESVGVSSGSRVIIVGEPLPAARLFFTLDYLGMGNRAALLDGGLPGWRGAGYPVSRDSVTATPGQFAPRPQPQLVVDADWVRGRLDDGRIRLLDARPAAEFRGETAGDGVPRAGHIPGAESLFWQLALKSPESGTLKSAAQLSTLVAAAGVRFDSDIVVYCRTGVQASYLYFVLRTLGYAPRMYDGSFIDWSRRADLEVE